MRRSPVPSGLVIAAQLAFLFALAFIAFASATAAAWPRHHSTHYHHSTRHYHHSTRHYHHSTRHRHYRIALASYSWRARHGGTARYVVRPHSLFRPPCGEDLYFELRRVVMYTVAPSGPVPHWIRGLWNHAGDRVIYNPDEAVRIDPADFAPELGIWDGDGFWNGTRYPVTIRGGCY